ncbi:MAG: mechanosensitive ion channel [Deltaproteobacteria bacterium]|nr:mechanosensitive ion channel [Deltaproteobacteria bacterium]
MFLGLYHASGSRIERISRILTLLIKIVLAFSLSFLAAYLLIPQVSSQPRLGSEIAPPSSPNGEKEDSTAVPLVAVEPRASDSEIEQRLLRIFSATGWFTNLSIEANDGVVSIAGGTADESHKEWAGDLARRTQDVVAVINRLQVLQRSVWDLSPAKEEVTKLGNAVVRGLPWTIAGLIILVLSYLLSLGAKRITAALLHRKMPSRLLVSVGARAVQALVIILGIYLVLRIAGLTRLAVTILGGTGLIGVVIGVAFHNITENFLASILLSIQRPFRPGDLVQIEKVLGYVQRITTRATVLMTLDGNHVQLPNSKVFREVIENYSTNPNRREQFSIGIGYGDSIPLAQKVALQTLSEHPSVLESPEPSVLVDNLGSSTVNLKIYFWLNGSVHSWLKVRSSVIRLTKRAFQENGITLPDEAREIIFPEGVPVHRAKQDARPKRDAVKHVVPDVEPTMSSAEGGLSSDADEIATQASHSRQPEEGSSTLMDGRQEPLAPLPAVMP